MFDAYLVRAILDNPVCCAARYAVVECMGISRSRIRTESTIKTTIYAKSRIFFFGQSTMTEACCGIILR